MRKFVWGVGLVVCIGAIFALGLVVEVPRKGQVKPVETRAVTASRSSRSFRTGQAVISNPQSPASVARQYAKLPLAFEPNLGQVNSEAKFLARGDGYALFLTPSEAVFAFSKPFIGKPAGKKKPGSSRASNNFLPDLARLARDTNFLNTDKRVELLRMRLVGASTAPGFTALDKLPGSSNYFVGKNPSGWRTNIPNYRQVVVAGVYPGVNLVYHGNQRQLEYDFVVRPGYNPQTIQLEFEGAEHLGVDSTGDLLLDQKGQKLRFHKPVVYQLAEETSSASEGNLSKFSEPAQDGQQSKNLVAGRYVIVGKNRVGFRVADYDHSKDLVIDPTLSYSTYLGGINKEIGSGIAVDSSGNAYVTGETCSPNFPTVTPLTQTPPTTNVGANCDAFVAKLDPTGSSLLYSTFLGGSNGDLGAAIAIDNSGNAYVTGLTSSTDFPTTPGAFQTTYGGGNSDVFVAKLNPAGSALVYSTYLGGNDSENGAGIAVDSSGNANVTGQTCSANFPVLNGFQLVYGGNCDAFVSNLNPTGTALVYSTYLGGSQTEAAYAIAVDKLGAAFITGATCSDFGDFPLKNSLEDENAGPPDFPCDAFVSKVGLDGSLAYSTFLGDSGQDAGYGIAVDNQGFAYVTGMTTSPNFLLTQGAYDTACGTDGGCNPDSGGHPRADAFVSKLNVQGSALIYSTYLGGSDTDIGLGIAVDINENAYVTGATQSTDFPTANPEQPAYGGGPRDAFVTKLNASGTGLIFSTFLGGNDDDAGNSIAVDGSGNMYVTGTTASINFPTTARGFQLANAGNVDAFVTKILAVTAPVPILSPRFFTFSDQVVGSSSPPQVVTLKNEGDADLLIVGIQATGDFTQTNNCPSGSGQRLAPSASCSISVSFAPSSVGILAGTLSVTDNAANSPQSIKLTGNAVNPPSSLTLSALGLPFGNQQVGTSSNALSVKATNTGKFPLTFSSITGSGDFSETDNCMKASLQPSTTCVINVTFSPTAAGSSVGALTLTDNVQGSPQVILLTGTGFGALSDFTISDAQPNATVPAGRSATFTLMLSSTGGFNQPVTLSCSGLPREANCSIPTNPVMPTAAPGTAATVTVTTGLRSVVPLSLRIPRGPFGGMRYFVPWLTALVLLLMLAMLRGIRRRPAKAAFGLAVIVLLVAAGCNAGSQSGVPAGTPAGTYQITVTGTSGAITHTTMLSLQVN